MLTMRFVAVRDVLDPSRGVSAAAEEGLGITTQGNNNPNALWSVQVQHGGQRQRTRSIAISTKQKPGQESSQQVSTHIPCLLSLSLEMHQHGQLLSSSSCVVLSVIIRTITLLI